MPEKPTIEPRQLSGAVLVGGGSRRMGTSKADLDCGGDLLLERTLRVLQLYVTSLAVVGGASADAALGHIDAELRHAVQWLPDVAEHYGPLAGILAALRHDPQSDWLCVACDMPAITSEAIAWLREQRAQSDADVTAARLEEHAPIEPLLAIYSPTAFAKLTATLASGERSLRRGLASVRVSSPVVPQDLRSAWINVNTPAEWRAFQDQAAITRPVK